MPQPGLAWWHVIISTYGSWLPGDDRGFRNRDHRIHSSGGYRHRPPPGEHAGLHRYAKEISDPEVVFRDRSVRKRVGQELVRLLKDMGYRVLVLTVCRTHAHILAELSIRAPAFEAVIKKLKIKSSAAIRDVLPGRVWARGKSNFLKKTPKAQQSGFFYIRDAQEAGAYVWTFAKVIRPAR